MSKKKWCGLLAVLMAVSIVFTSGALRPVNVYAETIADLQEQSEEHQKKLEEINQQIEEAEANKADALEQKNLLDQQADVLRSQISNAQQQIDALEAELADNQQKEEAQYDLFCRQVRDEEERGTASFWSVIFKATSFSDLLGRIDFINEVAEHDQSVISDLRQLRQQMQADRQALEEQRSQLESRQTELDSQLEAATQLIAKYNETADGLNDLAAQEKAAADELDAQIQARREEENRNNGGDNSGGSGGGSSSGSGETPSSDGYIWPSDCRLITSGYGGRDQPTPGASTNHMGVDIGASYGSYIYAVKSGTVVGSKYSWGGYGNYVEIDHGNGNFTLYAHMSERLVEVGEHVEQGEVIGLCGSTGISTGPPRPLRDLGELQPHQSAEPSAGVHPLLVVSALSPPAPLGAGGEFFMPSFSRRRAIDWWKGGAVLWWDMCDGRRSGKSSPCGAVRWETGRCACWRAADG